MHWGTAVTRMAGRTFDLMVGVLFRLGLFAIAMATVLEMRRTKTRRRR